METPPTEIFSSEDSSVSEEEIGSETSLAWYPHTPGSDIPEYPFIGGDSPERNEVQVPKRKEWKASLKSVFCTWPQAEVPLNEFEKRVRAQYPSLEWAVVCRELHQDGNPHMHAVLGFMLKTRLTSKKLDAIVGKHGDYKHCKGMKKALEYVRKGGNFLDIGPVPQLNVPVITQIAQMVKAGKRARDIDAQFPGTYLQNKKKIDEYITWNDMQNMEKLLKPWEECPLKAPEDVISGPNSQILEWLLKNIRKPREFKQEQLYIWGPPGLGKTHLVNMLAQYVAVYNIPTDEEFYDEWQDGLYDVAVMDEFKASKKIQWLNQFLQGSLMTMRQKGKQTLKRQNIPVIILSNFGLHECYHKAANSGILDTLYARLLCVSG